MFKGQQRFLRKIFNAVSSPPFDPATLGDPVAMTTEWTPIQRGGANFKTHALLIVSPDRLEFKATGKAKIFHLFLVLIGAIVAILHASKFPQHPSELPLFPLLLPFLIAAVLIVIGLSKFWSGLAPVVFDRSKGYFWRGRQAPHETFNKDEIKHHAALEDIYALQLLRERIQSNKTSYYSFELNLVLKDGRRVHVVDHGNIETLRENAAAIGTFLGRPVWDAT